MSPGRRGRDGDKPKKGRDEDEVSLADRLGPARQHGAPPPGSVLPGQGAGRSAREEQPRSERSTGTVLPGKGSVAPVPRQTRRQLRRQREEQKRRERQRWILTGLAVLGVVVVGILLAVWISGGDDGASTVSEGQRTERTMTITLAADNSAATSGALMVDDSANASAGAVLVPSRLFVEGPTPSGIPFGETVLLGDVAAPGNALADTLDVVVDDTWQVSNSMLSALVDDVGGVLVDVDVDVLDGRNIVLTAGDGQLLNGRQAVAYATYLGDGEVEEARLVRFGDVLDQLMRQLPDNRDTLVDVFTRVDATAQATLSVEQLADVVQSYGDVARGGDAQYQTLPTTVLESGGGLPALAVDPQGLERLRNGLLADSLPPDAGGDQIAVYVQNGVGTPRLNDGAGEKLRNAGYEYLNGGNANEFGRKQTVVLIPDSGAASVSLGESVAATLGVPASAVQVSEQGQSVADVVVVLGEDFKP
jgi:hypothetical protein